MASQPTPPLSFFARLWLAIVGWWCRTFWSDRRLSRATITPFEFTDVEGSPRLAPQSVQPSRRISTRYGHNLHVERPRASQQISKQLSQWKSGKAEFLRSPSLTRGTRNHLPLPAGIESPQRPSHQHRRNTETVSPLSLNPIPPPQIFVQDWDVPGSVMSPVRPSFDSDVRPSFDSDVRPSVPPPRPVSPAPRLSLDFDDETVPSPTSSTFSLDDDSVPLIVLKERRIALQAAAPFLVSRSNIVSIPALPTSNQSLETIQESNSRASVTTLAPSNPTDQDDDSEPAVQPNFDKENVVSPCVASTPPNHSNAHSKTLFTPPSVISPLRSKRQTIQSFTSIDSQPYTDVFDLSSYTGHQSLSFDITDSSIVISPMKDTPVKRQSKNVNPLRDSYGAALMKERLESSPPVSPDPSLSSPIPENSSFCFRAQHILGLNGEYQPSDYLPRLQSNPGRRSRSVFIAPSTPPSGMSAMKVPLHAKRNSSPAGIGSVGMGVPRRRTVEGVVEGLQQAFHDVSLDSAASSSIEEYDAIGLGFASGLDEIAWRRVYADLA
ncbi:hypothetical protein DL96DRAFT_1625156 [Flagelloscypha sp. PMI_526]|nr:hypothetical protein DL96DRAFT_1625156 [Flagelloscypha sp. PMI_526]